MSTEPTTHEQVQAALDAYDRTAAELVHLSRELRGVVANLPKVDELLARSMVALAEREYAWGVYVSTWRDHHHADMAVSA